MIVRKLAGFALCAVLLGLSIPADAQGLDVQAWLRRPGVKLLAVEFYATWCKPCMAAVPRWKALHERYRKDGLRLVVIATQDPQGGCVNPGWNPDEIVCDDDGQLAARLGAASLPSAFLWSWQGELLVRQGHVDSVESKIVDWLGTTPRVDVVVEKVVGGTGLSKQALSDLVRARLRDADKLTVVATAAERKQLDAVRRKSFDQRYDDKSRCEIGMELSPSSLLQVSVTGKRRKLLRLGLLSLERGCLVASAVVDWNKRKPAVAVAEGVATLMGKLRSRPKMPWSQGSSSRTRPGLSPYQKMARELEAAKAKARQLEEAWTVVRRFAASDSISKPRRADAIRAFLKDFATANPHSKEAQRLLASLQPALLKKLAPVRTPQTPRAPERAPAPEGAPARAPTPKNADRDGDGIFDSKDACPVVPEDMDGFQDADGCPDPDNDKDGVLDRLDACPNSPETMNGFKDGDGCPDKAPTRQVHVQSERLQITEKIQFQAGKAKIRKQSFAVLDGVAAVLRERAEIAHLAVEGHTDSRGSSSANRRLSQRRAESVVAALAQRGVQTHRLSAMGYGEDRPLDDNRTAKGRSANRRIEFVIGPAPKKPQRKRPKRKTREPKTSELLAVRRSWDQRVQRVIRRHLRRIQNCYKRELVSQPDLAGRVDTQFTIGTNGRVQAVRVAKSTLKNATAERCIQTQIRRWRFPKPEGGVATIKYPFIFKK